MQLRPGSLLAPLVLLTGGTSFAADQTVPGAGNATAAGSPRVAQAERFLVEQAERIRDRAIRAATLDLLANPHVCIRHRTGLASTAARVRSRDWLDQLKRRHLSHFSAERLLGVYATGGLDAVADEIQPLRHRGVL